MYKTGAKNRNHSFDLTQQEFESLIFQNCYYCGAEPTPATKQALKARGNVNQPTLYYNGIDRIDLNLGYNLDNCVPCCSNCNYMKRMHTKEEFLKHIDKIYNFQHQSSETIEMTSVDGTK